jgi:hypothetical protein
VLVKHYVTALVAAAGLVSPAIPASGQPNPFAADVDHRSFTVTGTVVSVRSGALVLRIDDHQHRLPFSLGPSVSPAELRAGARVSVRYHPTGSAGQVADAVEITGPRR